MNLFRHWSLLLFVLCSLSVTNTTAKGKKAAARRNKVKEHRQVVSIINRILMYNEYS